jgi:hypothetical protein
VAGITTKCKDLLHIIIIAILHDPSAAAGGWRQQKKKPNGSRLTQKLVQRVPNFSCFSSLTNNNK